MPRTIKSWIKFFGKETSTEFRCWLLQVTHVRWWPTSIKRVWTTHHFHCESLSRIPIGIVYDIFDIPCQVLPDYLTDWYRSLWSFANALTIPIILFIDILQGIAILHIPQFWASIPNHAQFFYKAGNWDWWKLLLSLLFISGFPETLGTGVAMYEVFKKELSPNSTNIFLSEAFFIIISSILSQWCKSLASEALQSTDVPLYFIDTLRIQPWQFNTGWQLISNSFLWPQKNLFWHTSVYFASLILGFNIYSKMLSIDPVQLLIPGVIACWNYAAIILHYFKESGYEMQKFWLKFISCAIIQAQERTIE